MIRDKYIELFWLILKPFKFATVTNPWYVAEYLDLPPPERLSHRG